MQKKLFRLAPKEVIFMECDIQDKFIKHVQLGASVVHNAKRLAQTAQIFKIPVISTQQLPKIFGPTVKEIDEVYQNSQDSTFRFEKTDFSMLEKPVWEQIQSFSERKKVVLYGIESHVCVKQTCFDLLERDY